MYHADIWRGPALKLGDETNISVAEVGSDEDAVADFQAAEEVEGFALEVAAAVGDEVVDGVDDAGAVTAVGVGFLSVAIGPHGLYQTVGTRQGGLNGSLDVGYVGDVDEMWAGSGVVEGDDGFVEQHVFEYYARGVA